MAGQLRRLTGPRPAARARRLLLPAAPGPAGRGPAAAAAVAAGGEAAADVDVRAVLASCVRACDRGCREVRAWQAARTAATAVELKDAGDPKSAVTAADLAAQAAIVAALRAEWPGLAVVGEEDGAVPVALAADRGDPGDPGAAPPLELPGVAGAKPVEVPLAELTVLVDPVDGTRELVEGRVGAVQTLVGVAYRGRALAGAVGVPFPGGSAAAEPVVHYGLVGAGFGGGVVEAGPGGTGFREAAPETGDRTRTGPAYTTGDSRDPSLAAAKGVLEASCTSSAPE